MSRLQGQVVIVTGGGMGIGRAYCEGLAREGAKIAVVDIDAGAATTVAQALTATGGEALAVGTDVSQETATAHVAEAVVERFGRIDGLVNNAAVFYHPAVSRGPFEEISAAEWDRVMAVNLRGMFLCARAVVPTMKAQRSGRIVNISSGTVHHGTPYFAHYVTSKAGVIGFTRAIARELGDYGIGVNAIAPGATQSLPNADEARLQRQWEQAQLRSLKRLETPEDLVGTLIFLLSAESAFITGQTITVDGGATMP